MVNDRDDKYEEHEEGEYHFSDDQGVYETEAEGEAPKVEAAASSGSALASLSKYRRQIIGTAVILLLVGVIYKVVTPAATQPDTDIGQSAPAAHNPAKVPVTEVVATTPTPAVSPSQSVATAEPAAQTQQPTPIPVATELPAALSSSATPASTQQQLSTQQPQPPVIVQATGGPVTSASERLALLEEQNSKLMATVQTEYAQKLANYQTQNDQMREQLQDLNTRMGNIEKSLGQLLRAVRGKPAAADEGSVPTSTPQVATTDAATKVGEPKVIYSVQAIIPGRAWLKSDSGDTITVAEGDSLKGYGRITKIDPYDGIVEIDTGSKIISLSYGVNGD